MDGRRLVPVAEQAARRPEAVAVEQGAARLTWGLEPEQARDAAESAPPGRRRAADRPAGHTRGLAVCGAGAAGVVSSLRVETHRERREPPIMHRGRHPGREAIHDPGSGGIRLRRVFDLAEIPAGGCQRDAIGGGGHLVCPGPSLPRPSRGDRGSEPSRAPRPSLGERRLGSLVPLRPGRGLRSFGSAVYFGKR